jgi:hypothetical protein
VASAVAKVGKLVWQGNVRYLSNHMVWPLQSCLITQDGGFQQVACKLAITKDMLSLTLAQTSVNVACVWSNACQSCWILLSQCITYKDKFLPCSKVIYHSCFWYMFLCFFIFCRLGTIPRLVHLTLQTK